MFDTSLLRVCAKPVLLLRVCAVEERDVVEINELCIPSPLLVCALSTTPPTRRRQMPCAVFETNYSTYVSLIVRILARDATCSIVISVDGIPRLSSYPLDLLSVPSEYR